MGGLYLSTLMTRDIPNVGVEALGREVFFEGAGRFLGSQARLGASTFVGRWI